MSQLQESPVVRKFRTTANDELVGTSVIRKFRMTASDGKADTTAHHHRDAIIAVGFRVNSTLTTQFRQWDIGILHDLKAA